MTINTNCWGSTFTPEEIEKTRTNGGLLTMEIELSRACNLRCIYCYADSGEALEEKLSLDSILDAVDQGVALGAQKIIVLGGGEPLVYPHIETVLRYIHDKGVRIELFTNGILLKEKLVNLLMELRVEPFELEKLFKTLAHIDEERFGISWEPHPSVAAFTCNRHSYSCTITVTGDVIPCPEVDIAVGNILTTPLKEVLSESTVINDLRNISDRITGTCKSYELNGRCYGCRGMAYQATGDYLASDPLCWKHEKEAVV